MHGIILGILKDFDFMQNLENIESKEKNFAKAYEIFLLRVCIFYAILQSIIYLDGSFIGLFSADTKLNPFFLNWDLRWGLWTQDAYGEWLAGELAVQWSPPFYLKWLFPIAPAHSTMFMLLLIAYGSAIAAFFGVSTRISAPLAIGSCFLIASIFNSWGTYWSRGLMLPQIVGLCYVMALYAPVVSKRSSPSVPVYLHAYRDCWGAMVIAIFALVAIAPRLTSALRAAIRSDGTDYSALILLLSAAVGLVVAIACLMRFPKRRIGHALCALAMMAVIVVSGYTKDVWYQNWWPLIAYLVVRAGILPSTFNILRIVAVWISALGGKIFRIPLQLIQKLHGTGKTLSTVSVAKMRHASAEKITNLAFAPGASLSIAICRIALFYATLQSLIYLDGAFIGLFSVDTSLGFFVWKTDFRIYYYYETWLANASASNWLPKGLVKIFFASGPPLPVVMYGLTATAYVSTVAALLGLATRITAPVSVISVLMVSSIFTSWGPYWSHGFNVVHLAGLAFMFGRSGDRLSLDALICKLFGRNPRVVPAREGIYRWPVMAGELAVHMFLFAAFWSKWMNGSGIWWALSDNLRNSLAVSWGLYRSHPPLIIDYIISHLWLFRFVGVAQMFMQGVTIISCVLIHRPVWRFLIGAVVMLLEILGLGVLFEFWHMNWITLAAFSIDWDKLVDAVRRRWSVIPLPTTISSAASPYGRRTTFALGGFFALFFGYYALNFLYQLGEKHLNYPFSSMAFFSENRAAKPYTQHRPWFENRGVLDIYVHGRDNPIGLAQLQTGLGEYWRATTATARLDAMNAIRATILRGTGFCKTEAELKQSGEWLPSYAGLRGLPFLRSCSRTVPSDSFDKVALYRVISAIPEHPKPPMPVHDAQRGLIGIAERDRISTLGVTLHLDPETQRWYIETEAIGLTIKEMSMHFRRGLEKVSSVDDIPSLEPMPGEWIGKTFMPDDTLTGIRELLRPLVRIVDEQHGELFFSAPDYYQYKVSGAQAGQYAKPLRR